MINQKSYVYPDINDSLTIQMIGEVEKETGINWGDDEKCVLTELEKLIQKKVKKTGSTLDDFGCGEGRLLSVFEKYFEKIIAIEPDKNRIEKAIKFAKKSNFYSKTRFINKLIENSNIDQSANVIILSHILQHVDPDAVDIIIKKTHDNLKSGGLLYLATNNMNGDRDKYTKSFFANGKLMESRINRKEFVALVNNDNRVLPIHWFSQKKLIKMLAENGFEILYSKTFHGSKNKPDRDLAIVAIKNSK